MDKDIDQEKIDSLLEGIVTIGNEIIEKHLKSLEPHQIERSDNIKPYEKILLVTALGMASYCMVDAISDLSVFSKDLTSIVANHPILLATPILLVKQSIKKKIETFAEKHKEYNIPYIMGRSLTIAFRKELLQTIQVSSAYAKRLAGLIDEAKNYLFAIHMENSSLNPKLKIFDPVNLESMKNTARGF